MTGEQLSLEVPLRVLARATDSETSQEAAAAFDAAGKMQPSVAALVALLRADAVSLDDFQIAARWRAFWGRDYSESLPRKARHWARQAGFVAHEGYGEHQGRRVRLWALTEKGRRA